MVRTLVCILSLVLSPLAGRAESFDRLVDRSRLIIDVDELRRDFPNERAAIEAGRRSMAFAIQEASSFDEIAELRARERHKGIIPQIALIEFAAASAVTSLGIKMALHGVPATEAPLRSIIPRLASPRVLAASLVVLAGGVIWSVHSDRPFSTLLLLTSTGEPIIAIEHLRFAFPVGPKSSLMSERAILESTVQFEWVRRSFLQAAAERDPSEGQRILQFLFSQITNHRESLERFLPDAWFMHNNFSKKDVPSLKSFMEGQRVFDRIFAESRVENFLMAKAMLFLKPLGENSERLSDELMRFSFWARSNLKSFTNQENPRWQELISRTDEALRTMHSPMFEPAMRNLARYAATMRRGTH